MTFRDRKGEWEDFRPKRTSVAAPPGTIDPSVPDFGAERWGSFTVFRPVGRMTIFGSPATKKTSPQPVYPVVWGLKLTDARGRPVKGLKGALAAIQRLVRRGRTSEAISKLGRLAAGAHPKILPSKAYSAWEKDALAAIAEAAHRGLPLPCVPEGHLLGVNARFYLAPRQRPDLSGLLEATGDALEAGKVIGNDYWIGSWLRSERVWPPGTTTKADKAARKRWTPRVEIHLYDLGER